jgi:D-aminopeptidase
MAMRNLITDVAGILVGNADDARVATGTSLVLFEEPAVASIAILGGAPGSRDTALLEPEMTVERVDAIVLSGGSAYGLEAAGGVMTALAAKGRGFAMGALRVPVVPSAILFDLANGGDKSFATGSGEPPYRRLGAEAVAAATHDFSLGTAGAGHGAMTVDLKGGLGSASTTTRAGHVVGALVAVNGVGSTIIGAGPHFWAGLYEQNGEYGGRGWPATVLPSAFTPRYKGGPGTSTTIAIVATDAALTKAECKRLALAADDGLARAIRPAHALLDGDTVFAAATGKKPLDDRIYDLTDIGVAAADCLARAVARGVYEAQALPFAGTRPAWRERFG